MVKQVFGNFRVTPTIIKGKASFVVMFRNIKIANFDTIGKAVLKAQSLHNNEKKALELANKAKQQALKALVKAEKIALSGIDFALLSKKEQKQLLQQRRKRKVEALKKTRKGRVFLVVEKFLLGEPKRKRKKRVKRRKN